MFPADRRNSLGNLYFCYHILIAGNGIRFRLHGMTAEIYPGGGYRVGVEGAFVGLVYGFLDGFIGLFVFAALYNFLGKKIGA